MLCNGAQLTSPLATLRDRARGVEAILRVVRFLVLGALFFGCQREATLGGNAGGVRGPQPDIVIEPPALVFPHLEEGQTATETFTVYNRGPAELDVSAIEVVTGAAGFTVTGPQSFELVTDQARTFDVTFRPYVQGDNFGRIEVVSDDPDEPRAPLDLVGGGSVPDLEITPRDFAFGEGFVPCGGDLELTLENVGSSDIVIDSVDYESSDGDMRLLELDDLREDLPITLAPGERERVDVRWWPREDADDAGTLLVGSNDPAGVERAEQSGTGVYVGQATETFATPGVPPVDVMFLIDQSCSMEEDNQDTLSAGIPAFFGKLRELSDWQLAQINSSSGCLNGVVYDGSTPLAESRFSDGAFRDLFDPDFPTEEESERLFEMATRALNETRTGGCNDGFLREGSLLHIVVASDEREQSTTSWRTHLENFRSFVDHPDLVRVSAIVDKTPNPPCAANGQGNTGYYDMAIETNGAVVDICTSNWGNQLPSLAEDVLEGVRSYNLQNRAVRSSIRVEVNGGPTDAFSYTDEARTVTILDPPVGQGDTVTISYAIAATCD